MLIKLALALMLKKNIALFKSYLCLLGGTGRHASIRNLCLRREGSSPSGGTMKKIIVRHKDFTLKVHISEDCTTILDSYQVKSPWDMESIIYYIKAEASADMAINKRNISSMIYEWRTHNLLYALGIMSGRTGSVDLNTNQPWYIKIAYALISPFYFHFS